MSSLPAPSERRVVADEQQREDPERRRDREQVEPDGDGGQHDRAQDRDQRQVGHEADREDDQRHARAVDALEVGQLRRGAADRARRCRSPLEAMRERSHVVDDLVLTRVVGPDVRHHEDARLACRRRRRRRCSTAPRGRRASRHRSPRPSGSRSGRSPASSRRACAARAAARTARCASRSWPRTVLIRLDAEPSPCCSCANSGVAFAPLRVEQLAAGREQRLRAAGQVVELRLHGRDAVARLTERRGELALARADGGQAGVDEPARAVGDLLHHVLELTRLDDRGIDLPARRLREGQLVRERGVEPREAAGLRRCEPAAAAPADGSERRSDVAARLGDRPGLTSPSGPAPRARPGGRACWSAPGRAAGSAAPARRAARSGR